MGTKRQRVIVLIGGKQTDVLKHFCGPWVERAVRRGCHTNHRDIKTEVRSINAAGYQLAVDVYVSGPVDRSKFCVAAIKSELNTTDNRIIKVAVL